MFLFFPKSAAQPAIGRYALMDLFLWLVLVRSVVRYKGRGEHVQVW